MKWLLVTPASLLIVLVCTWLMASHPNMPTILFAILFALGVVAMGGFIVSHIAWIGLLTQRRRP